MGCFDLYCCFCAGPFQDTRAGWQLNIKLAQQRRYSNSAQAELPSESTVTISSEDVKYWQDWVCVSPMWPSWISPPCDDEDGYGGPVIDGSTDWQNQSDDPYVVIHRGCLSFLCRRLDITPQELWESMYSPNSDYGKYSSSFTGLLYCLDYYDMKGRNGQFFGYAIERRTPNKENSEVLDIWNDYSTMVDLCWLLARPTVFPVVEPLSSTLPIASLSSPEKKSSIMSVLAVAELLDLILDHVINHLPQAQLASEFDASPYSTHIPPSVTSATKTVFSLLKVSRAFYTAIVRDRQQIFLRLAWEHGWMLPATPMDWAHWPNRAFHNGEIFQSVTPEGRDWRGYLLAFLRKDDVHVRNRWRMHRMAMQFAMGKGKVSETGEVTFKWRVGKKGVRTAVTAPKALEWELTPEM